MAAAKGQKVLVGGEPTKKNRMVEAAIENTMRKIQNGEFEDPTDWHYGDGDQSPLPSPNTSAESNQLQSLWGKNA